MAEVEKERGEQGSKVKQREMGVMAKDEEEKAEAGEVEKERFKCGDCEKVKMYFFVRSYLLITLIKCLKGQNIFVKIYLSKCVSQNVFLKMYFFVRSYLLITLIKCLKGKKTYPLATECTSKKIIFATA